MTTPRSEPPIRLGLVGYGADIGEPGHYSGGRGAFLFHLATRGFPGVVAAAVADTSASALEQAAAHCPGVRLFDNHRDLLESGGVDAVIVATPAHYHAPIAIEALAADIHVLSEIPAISSLEEAGALWQAADRGNALYMTGANPNFLGYFDAAVELQRQGLLGDPVLAEAEYIHDIRHLWQRTPWREDFEPIRYCTHSLGPLMRLIPGDLETVSCFGTGSRISTNPRANDFMSAQFQTASGVVVRILVSFVNEAVEHHQYRIFTTCGVFERTRPLPASMHPSGAELPRTLLRSNRLPAAPVKYTEIPVSDMPPEYAGNPHATGHGGVDYAMLAAFVRAVRSGGPSPVSLREGLRMSIPGLYAAESARRGGELLRIRYPWS